MDTQGIFCILDLFQCPEHVKDTALSCSLAITKLDILDDFDEIKVGIQYKLNGKVIEHYPASEAELRNVEVGAFVHMNDQMICSFKVSFHYIQLFDFHVSGCIRHNERLEAEHS